MIIGIHCRKLQINMKEVVLGWAIVVGWVALMWGWEGTKGTIGEDRKVVVVVEITRGWGIGQVAMLMHGAHC